MARLIETTHAYLEQIAYQMSIGVDWRRLGGPIALAKVQATKTMELYDLGKEISLWFFFSSLNVRLGARESRRKLLEATVASEEV